MRARAPGKVVISGAYAVFEGAPCIASAVDRYVIADDSREAQHVAEEVRAAMLPPFPYVDVTQLRTGERKLGLGSSAAIVVASLATRLEHPCETRAELVNLYQRALVAHRNAQGGGSGIDVAAATFGGNVLLRYEPSGPGRVAPVRLPDVHFEVWGCYQSASTSTFLSRVQEFKLSNPHQYSKLLGQLVSAASIAAAACETHSGDLWLEGLDQQATVLAQLGRFARIPIFTTEVFELRVLAQSEEAVVMPAGAGGGDIALFCGRAPPSRRLLVAAAARGLEPLQLTFGAPGVCRLESSDPS